MVVRLRLARWGRSNLPFYRIVAADSRFRRDGRHLEQLGTYDPIPDKSGSKNVRLNISRVKYWIAVGAQPSDPVQKLLSRFDLYPKQQHPSEIPLKDVPPSERPKLGIPVHPPLKNYIERHFSTSTSSSAVRSSSSSLLGKMFGSFLTSRTTLL